MPLNEKLQEPRYECPVCVGVRMWKIRPSKEVDLILDYCRECGGTWFDRGEVARLRKCRARALNAKIVLSQEAYRMQCHSCSSVIDRNVDTCSACGWKNLISCPVCAIRLKSTRRNDLKLDVCSRCKGVWFDNVELAQVWNETVESLTKGKPARKSREQNHFLLERVLPDIYIYDLGLPIQGIGGVFDAAGDLVSRVPEVAGSVVEGAGDVAGSVVEALPGVAEAAVEGAGDVAGSVVGALPGAAEVAVEGTGVIVGAVFEVIAGVVDG